ncbi:MAG: alpha/beta hydrolase [Mycobacterium sp.]|uniref:alpha/beta fold hydrolase n=1 Tax=Mycobacterium sp. TaxID=1785 RepID=UPI003BB4BB59
MEIRTGTARSGDLDIYYEDIGNPNDPAVLLIMGLGSQLLLWRDGFCEKLVAEGLRVIRYDNRDVGLSSKTQRRKTGGALIPTLLKFWLGMPGDADYRLEDMADDAAAVLDHLGIDRAHIVGASMGGMIAQIFAARFAARTRSLAVIFSSNNQPLLPPPAPRALFSILRGPKPDSPIDVIADNSVRVWRIIGSPAYPAPEQRLRDDAIEAYERCYYPWGVARHFSAVIASGSLARYNRQITAPTVVLHGRADKLQRPFGGRVVARAIRDARLVLFDGMGHDLPEQLWDRITGELTATFAQG